MQETEPINYVTIVRSPREHFLSYYYYYMQPVHKVICLPALGGVCVVYVFAFVI